MEGQDDVHRRLQELRLRLVREQMQNFQQQPSFPPVNNNSYYSNANQWYVQGGQQIPHHAQNSDPHNNSTSQGYVRELPSPLGVDDMNRGYGEGAAFPEPRQFGGVQLPWGGRGFPSPQEYVYRYGYLPAPGNSGPLMGIHPPHPQYGRWEEDEGVALLQIKQRQLEAAEVSLSQLRQQIRSITADQERRQRSNQLEVLTSAVDRLAGGEGVGGGPDKLDTILAQTLQMQTLMLAQMTSGGGMMMGVGRFGSQKGAEGMNQNREGDKGQEICGGDTTSRQGSPLGVAAKRQEREGIVPQASNRSEEDDALLKKMMELSEELSKAEDMAKNSADAAVAAAAKAVVQANPALDMQKKKDVKATALEEEGEEEEAEEVEEGDEMLKEEIDTYRDVARAWLRKAAKIVIGNVLMEPKTFLEVQEPYKGSMFRKGLSQENVETRLLKLSVRCKCLLNALDEAIQPKHINQPLLVFFRRLISPGLKFPETYFLHVERTFCEIEEGTHQLGIVTQDQAKFLVAQFLFTRIIIQQLVLKPWTCAIGPPVPAGKQETNNLKVMAAVLYRALCCSLTPDALPEGAEDKTVKDVSSFLNAYRH